MNDPTLSEQKERLRDDLEKGINHSVMAAMLNGGLSASSVIGMPLDATAGIIVAMFAPRDVETITNKCVDIFRAYVAKYRTEAEKLPPKKGTTLQ